MEPSAASSDRANRFYEIGPVTFIELRGRDCHKVLNNLATADLQPTWFAPQGRLPIPDNSGEKLLTGTQDDRSFTPHPGEQGQPRRIRESFFTDVKGKTVGHGLVLGHAEGLWVVGAAGQAERLIAHWDKYVIREDCQFIDRSAEYHPFLVRDQAARRIANELRIPLTEELVSVEASFAGIPLLLIQVRWSHQDEFLLLVKQDQAELMRGYLSGPHGKSADAEPYTLAPGDLAEWELYRIRFGWPVFGKDFTVTNLPQEIDRDRFAISFKKGCYLGQETIARLDALGQVQKKLLKWRIAAGEPRAGEKLIHEGNEAGQITSVAFDPEAGNFVALVMTRRSYFDKVIS